MGFKILFHYHQRANLSFVKRVFHWGCLITLHAQKAFSLKESLFQDSPLPLVIKGIRFKKGSKRLRIRDLTLNTRCTCSVVLKAECFDFSKNTSFPTLKASPSQIISAQRLHLSNFASPMEVDFKFNSHSKLKTVLLTMACYRNLLTDSQICLRIQDFQVSS